MKMKKLVINMIKGIIFGNFIANITYIILYMLDHNEGNYILLRLAENGNCIKMVIYVSISGIFLYVPSIIYEIFKNKIEEFTKFNVSNQKFISNYFLLLTVITICMLLFHKVQQIYIQKEFNILYMVLIMIVLIIKVWTPIIINFPTAVRQEVDWLNENLKNRNKD